MKYPRETATAVLLAARQLSDELERLIETSSVRFNRGFEDSFRDKQKRMDDVDAVDAEYVHGFIFGNLLRSMIKRKTIGTIQEP